MNYEAVKLDKGWILKQGGKQSNHTSIRNTINYIIRHNPRLKEFRIEIKEVGHGQL